MLDLVLHWVELGWPVKIFTFSITFLWLDGRLQHKNAKIETKSIQAAHWVASSINACLMQPNTGFELYCELTLGAYLLWLSFLSFLSRIWMLLIVSVSLICWSNERQTVLNDKTTTKDVVPNYRRTLLLPSRLQLSSSAFSASVQLNRQKKCKSIGRVEIHHNMNKHILEPVLSRNVSSSLE